MSKVLILGAHGQIARLVESQLTDVAPDTQQVLFLRNAKRLTNVQSNQTVIDGDVTDQSALVAAMKGVDVVYANLAGHNIKAQAQAVVAAMHEVGLSRLIWISTLGIYDEVPGAFGQWNNATLGSYLTTYASAAKVLEDSDLDYTIIRPAWLTDKTVTDYELTQKGEPFKGTEVSRQSVAAFVVSLIQDPTQESRHSVGINQPNTDGPKPAWY